MRSNSCRDLTCYSKDEPPNLTLLCHLPPVACVWKQWAELALQGCKRAAVLCLEAMSCPLPLEEHLLLLQDVLLLPGLVVPLLLGSSAWSRGTQSILVLYKT